LNNLSEVLRDLGEYEKEKSKLLIAKKIYIKHYGENHVEYAKILNNLSLVLRNLGEYEDSKKGFLIAKKILDKLFGKVHV
jgi:tetratricopeptide (TPR) repeat protein